MWEISPRAYSCRVSESNRQSPKRIRIDFTRKRVPNYRPTGRPASAKPAFFKGLSNDSAGIGAVASLGEGTEGRMKNFVGVAALVLASSCLAMPCVGQTPILLPEFPVDPASELAEDD